MIELAVFDLGRVLIRICNDWRHACEVAGVSLPATMRELSDAERELAHQHTIAIDSGKIGVDEFAARMAVLRGLEAGQIVRAYDVFLQGTFPGAFELIDQINAAGVKTACLSNTSPGHWEQMNNPASPNYLPLSRMTHRFASHLIGFCKPSPEIYEHVERTSGVRPEAIAFFDDLEANVSAAQQRGWMARRIEVGPDPIEQARNYLGDLGVL